MLAAHGFAHLVEAGNRRGKCVQTQQGQAAQGKQTGDDTHVGFPEKASGHELEKFHTLNSRSTSGNRDGTG